MATSGRISRGNLTENESCPSVFIRPLPKVALLWPVLVCALFCALAMYISPAYARGWGRLFLTVLFLNFFVLAFDFTAVPAMLLGAFIAIVVLAGALIEFKFVDFLPHLTRALNAVSPEANTWFYVLVAAGLFVIFAGIMLVHRRFNYWEVAHNRLIHHIGIRESMRIYPTNQLLMQKDNPDVFEKLLLRSGRLVFNVDGVAEAIVLENVVNIDRVERQVQEMLEVLRVESFGPVSHPAPRDRAPV